MIINIDFYRKNYKIIIENFNIKKIKYQVNGNLYIWFFR